MVTWRAEPMDDRGRCGGAVDSAGFRAGWDPAKFHACGDAAIQPTKA
jgi:hypothetical protein